MKKYILQVSLLSLLNLQCTKTLEQKDFITISNENGPILGYSPASGVKIIEIDSHKFKDLNKNGVLDPYEDWRLTPDERAKDLAGRIEPAIFIRTNKSEQISLKNYYLCPKQ